MMILFLLLFSFAQLSHSSVDPQALKELRVHLNLKIDDLVCQVEMLAKVNEEYVACTVKTDSHENILHIKGQTIGDDQVHFLARIEKVGFDGSKSIITEPNLVAKIGEKIKIELGARSPHSESSAFSLEIEPKAL